MRETWQTVDGTTVRMRQADTDAERAQLRRETTMLGLARHPAVVEVVSADDERGELATRTRAHVTLDGVTEPGSRDWLKALAGAAQTVADLHALGLVHGDLRAANIWVDDRGHVVLDGFDHAGLAGERVGGGPALRPSSDVAALAGLATRGAPTDPDARLAEGGEQPSRPRRGRGQPAGPGPELTAVLASGQAGGWPPARRLAHALDAELARRGDGEARALPATGQTRRTRPVGRPGMAATTRPDPRTRADPSPAREPVVDPDPDPFAHLRPVDEPVRPRRWHRSDPSPPRRRPPVLAIALAMVGVMALGVGASRVGAHPSRPNLVPGPAPVVSIAGTSYRIGQAGDQVQVGSWGCDRTRAVVLRPSTGEVFVFDGWARPDHDLVARPVAHVARGSRLVATHQPNGCDGLSVTEAGGIRIDLDGQVAR